MSASSFYHRRKSVKDVLNFIDDFIACSLAVLFVVLITYVQCKCSNIYLILISPLIGK